MLVVAVEGVNASGKSTLVQYLKDALEVRGFRVKSLKAPDYLCSETGNTILEFLKGRTHSG